VAMVKVLAVGTLKKGFPLHADGLGEAVYIGEYRTRERYPLIVAGEWYAPMLLNEPGRGLQVRGELYDVCTSTLVKLDAIESVGRPGNGRMLVTVEPVDGGGASAEAIVFVKSRSLALPVHSDYLEDYQDRRFIPPTER
jgi:gamma-glutamylaminecyclotransferase